MSIPSELCALIFADKANKTYLMLVRLDFPSSGYDSLVQHYKTFSRNLLPLSSHEMQAAGDFEMMVMIYHAMWHHIPEDINLFTLT
jgi:hypothetical protein